VGAGKHWTPSQIKTRTVNFLDEYKTKYIDTGSAKPLTDVMIGLFFFSYAVAWPQVSPGRSARDRNTWLTLLLQVLCCILL
jgi:hypothetical protein